MPLSLSLRSLLQLVTLVFGLISLASCRKDLAETTTSASSSLAPAVNNGLSAEYKLKDTVLRNTRDFYLWYNQIPSSFDAQSYADPEKIMTAIRAFSIETGYTSAVDRWSFAMKKTEWDNLSRGSVQQTTAGDTDLGLNVFFRVEGDLRVRYVEQESPAGKAGIKRGWRITKINGSTNTTTSNSTAIIKAVYESASSTFTFLLPDGSGKDITLQAASYTSHPVVLDSVYTVANKKVGYLVFNSFLGDTAQIYNDFNRVFNRFSREGIAELVVDLRYNGGGYVTVQERLANYLINGTYNGQVMMSEKYNDRHTNYNSTSRFAKRGSVNLNRLFFIVSGNTASASELLINNLKPYMDVRLVGPSKTTGKPVGFFPIPVGEWYVFPVSFRTVNKNGEGNYFGGLALTNSAGDGIDKDWGDRSETALASILNSFANGSFRSEVQTATDPAIDDINKKLYQNAFNGIIDTRKPF